MRFSTKINPLPQGDDWALLNDGTIAVVRVLDYHVDYYLADGTHTSSPRLPFDWKRISDDDKSKMVDSLKIMAKAISDRAAAGGNSGMRMSFDVIDANKLPDYYPPIRQGSTMADHDGNLWILPSTSNLAAQIAQSMSGGGGRGGFGGPPSGGAPVGGAPVGGAPAGARAAGDTVRAAAGDTAGRGGRGARGGRGGDANATAGGMAGGMAGMMPAGVAAAMTAPLVYDVINRKGELVHRVQLPVGRQLLGFGRNGTVYLAAREGREMFIEKTRVAN
jgi:hypothetical protein